MNNLIGKVFERITVLSQDLNDKRKYFCKCSCGKEKLIFKQSLTNGRTKSCGCLNIEKSRERLSNGFCFIFTKDYLIKKHICEKISLRQIARNNNCTVSCVMKYMKKFDLKSNDLKIDLNNQVFGKLKVVKFFDANKNCGSRWVVECECGVTKIVNGSSLIRRKIVSCGCYNKSKCKKGYFDISGSYWGVLKASAKKRNIEFNISMEYVWNLFEKQNKKCALSGRDIFLSGNRNIKQTASLDRINSNLGYIEGNVQWTHKLINVMKWDMSNEEFIIWCKKIFDYNT